MAFPALPRVGHERKSSRGERTLTPSAQLFLPNFLSDHCDGCPTQDPLRAALVAFIWLPPLCARDFRCPLYQPSSVPLTPHVHIVLRALGTDDRHLGRRRWHLRALHPLCHAACQARVPHQAARCTPVCSVSSRSRSLARFSFAQVGTYYEDPRPASDRPQ